MSSKDSSAKLDRESNERIQEKNRESQEYINQTNLDFQRENLAYQKATQQQIFDREDTAYQRTVNDMRAAGLSPLTMNGTNGAGEAIQTSALDAGDAYREEGLFNRVDEFNSKMAVLKNAADTLKDIFALPGQLKSVQLDNEYKSKSMNTRLTSARLAELAQAYDISDKARKDAFDSFFGTNSSMSQAERVGMMLNTLMSKGSALKATHEIPFYNPDGSYNYGIDSHYNFSDEKVELIREVMNSLKKLKKSDNLDASRDEHLKLLRKYFWD